MDAALLPLSRADIEHLAAAQRVLLSPLGFAGADAWCAAVSTALQPLFGHEQLLGFLGTSAGKPSFYTEGISLATIEAYLSEYAARDPGASALFDARQTIVTSGSIAASIGPDAWRVFSRSEAFNEWYRPNRILGTAGLTLREDAAPPAPGMLTDGMRAALMMYFPSWNLPGSEERRQILLHLLHPAFEAAVHALRRLGSARQRLGALLDDLGEALILVDSDGMMLHQSPALRALLDHEPERDLVRARMAALAQSVTALATSRIRTRAGCYLARASLLGEELIGQPAVVVLLAPVKRDFPTIRLLMERFHLTRQEAQVARMLAERKTNQEVSEALAVSPHTARWHTQRVLEKLGLSSRVAVRDRLMEA